MKKHVPNTITIIGAMLTASAIAAYLTPQVPPPIVLLCLVGGQVCDVLDGHTARRWDTVSSFGAELDLTCDRVLAHLLAFAVVGVPWLLLAPLTIAVQVISGTSMSGRSSAAGLMAISVLHAHFL